MNYETLEDRETISALSRELEQLAEEHDGTHRKHILESKRDAESRLKPSRSRIMDELHELTDRLE